MEFHERLQELRKQKGMTQEELARELFVSRTAISKWESGRGYPNIDSLKAIAAFFSVSLDSLLSGGEALTIAEADLKQTEKRLLDVVFGLLDLSAMLFLFLPFFGEKVGEQVRAVSLPALAGVGAYVKIAYFAVVVALMVWGVLTLALQSCTGSFWVRRKVGVSLLLGGAGVLLFIIGSQPYAAAYLFVLLAMKGIVLWKKR